MKPSADVVPRPVVASVVAHVDSRTTWLWRRRWLVCAALLCHRAVGDRPARPVGGRRRRLVADVPAVAFIARGIFSAARRPCMHLAAGLFLLAGLAARDALVADLLGRDLC